MGFDVESAFANMVTEQHKADEEKNRKSGAVEGAYEYPTCEMCWNLGTFVGKIIPDSNTTPLRTIDNLRIGFIPILKDDGSGSYKRKFYVAPKDQYKCLLTDSQKDIQDKLISALDENIRLSEEHNTKPLCKTVKKATIFYMMIRRFIDDSGKIKEYPNPNVTVMIHRSFSFKSAFVKSIDTRSKNYGGTQWIPKFFAREAGDCDSFISISTSRQTGPYVTTIDWLNDLMPFKFEVTEEMINSANDINNELVNVNSYDEEYYKDLLERVLKVNQELGGMGPMEVYNPPTENKNASEVNK